MRVATRLAALSLGAMLAGCAPAVQRAGLTPAFEDVKVETASPPPAQGRRFAFRSPRARVHVFSNDLLNGDHHLLFSPVRGTYVVDEASRRARLHVEIGMRGLRAESGWIAEFASRMLDVENHPRTIIDARVDPIDGEPIKRLVTGNITLRGVERGIRFRADVSDDADGVRLHAVFNMSRSAFGIRADPGDGDQLIRDDFTVTIDLRAIPERVFVEDAPEPQVPDGDPDVLDAPAPDD